MQINAGSLLFCLFVYCRIKIRFYICQTKTNNSNPFKPKKMTTENSTPKDIIDIPQIENYDLFERNREKADDLGEQHCPCCGKVLLNPKFFINSIWGGQAYPASDKNEYSDAWVMGVGSECRKKFPEGYIFTNNI